jgi:hypothetical protein
LSASLPVTAASSVSAPSPEPAGVSSAPSLEPAGALPAPAAASISSLPSPEAAEPAEELAWQDVMARAKARAEKPRTEERGTGEELAWQDVMARAKARTEEPRTEEREWHSLTTAAKLQALADRARQERAGEDEWARSARMVRNRATRSETGAAGGARRG